MLPRLLKANDIRKHQINTLKIFNENVAEIIEGEEYDLYFNSGGNNLCLKVSLPKDFPNEKPSLKIIPTIVHTWITSDGDITSAPGLLNWTVHSDLGRVVQAIIREYQRTPPPLAVNQSASMSPTIPISKKIFFICQKLVFIIEISDGEIRASPINFSTFSNMKSFSPPPHPQQILSIPELSTLTLDELQFLNENTDKQDEFIEQLAPIKEQNKALDSLIQNVEELAESNFSKEDKLKELKKSVENRLEEITKLAFENERLHSVYQQLYDKYAPRNIQEQLKLEAEKADIESERVAESFLNGDIDVDKFVSDFIKIKTLSQSRKTKEEKLGQQLDRLEQAGF
ncbi:vacuolar protein sorting-associated protein 37A isoform X1 [Diorhabda carinulata]|uniref:vacuolar protein sorting-associated protein 37A isoform X1 n=1 Tax=Diorhabda carinulata TaxID=1163345 RepID=UPI0025A1E3D3|nr:vacuolar protein sorting-associated protein 37A isoform X1 [Diorhabda carinulata]